MIKKESFTHRFQGRYKINKEVIIREFAIKRCKDDFLGLGELNTRNAREFKRIMAIHSPILLQDPRLLIFSNFIVPENKDRFLRTFCPWGGEKKLPWNPRKSEAKAKVLTGFWINSEFRDKSWNLNYFHWHRNFLSHLVFVNQQGFRNINVIVEDHLVDYKYRSLIAIGITNSQIIKLSDIKGYQLENLIAVKGLDQNYGKSSYFDFVSPSTLRDLSKVMLNYVGINSIKRDLNLYVRRGNVGDRRVLNESEVISFLESKAGYLAIDVGTMDYEQQIRIFSRAKNIVGMHGGALTNILFSRKPQIMEFAASGHGWRPDFFPFAKSSGGYLALVGLPSVNQDNDVIIPRKILKWWLDKQELRSNIAIRL